MLTITSATAKRGSSSRPERKDALSRELLPGRLGKTILKQMGRTHVRFTAFRRFRESVLLRSECRQVLIDYWMGHENPDMSARYGRQLVEDVKYRKQWAEKVGLGFELPQVSKPQLDAFCATCATNSVEQGCDRKCVSA